MGYIDRSGFMQELQNNPGLVRRLGIIVNGEVGNGPLQDKLINLESIFNRAEARGQTLAQVTQQHFTKGDAGYYPQSTFDNGTRILDRGNNSGAFNEQVLKPVLAGSDVSTRVLGFPATGNASNGPTNFANSQIQNGVYTRYKWMGDPRNSEAYVQQRGDNVGRIEAKRTGDPPVQPPGSIPNPAVGANETYIDPVTGNARPSTGSIAAAMTGAPSANYPPAQNPGYRLPVQQSVEGGGSVPLPWRRPAGAGPDAAGNVPQQGPTEAQLAGQLAAAARPGTGPMTPLQSIGQKMLEAFHSAGGVVPPGASSYIDPTTKHTIINPSGSGEQAMGLTRDVGAVPASVTGQTVRPAPAPSSPAAATSATPPPAGPVSSQRATVPDVLAPLFPHTLDEGPTPPDALRTLDEGPTPTSAISPLMSRQTQPDILAGMQTGGGGGRLPLAPRWMSDARPVADARLQPSPVNPTVFDVKQIARQGGPGLAGLSGPVPVAPEAAGLLAPPSSQSAPPDRFLAPPQPMQASPAIAPVQSQPNGGQPLPSIPPTQPTTVVQQLGGLSPFASQAPQPQPQMPFAPTQQEQDQWLSRFLLNPQQTAFASTTLLPFNMVPSTGFDTAGWNSPASYNFGDPG